MTHHYFMPPGDRCPRSLWFNFKMRLGSQIGSLAQGCSKWIYLGGLPLIVRKGKCWLGFRPSAVVKFELGCLRCPVTEVFVARSGKAWKIYQGPSEALLQVSPSYVWWFPNVLTRYKKPESTVSSTFKILLAKGPVALESVQNKGPFSQSSKPELGNSHTSLDFEQPEAVDLSEARGKPTTTCPSRWMPCYISWIEWLDIRQSVSLFWDSYRQRVVQMLCCAAVIRYRSCHSSALRHHHLTSRSLNHFACGPLTKQMTHLATLNSLA